MALVFSLSYCALFPENRLLHGLSPSLRERAQQLQESSLPRISPLYVVISTCVSTCVRHPAVGLTSLYSVSPLAPGGGHNYFHFTDEEAEAQGG